MTGHSERKHSKFSASGSERWHACPGSVSLSEGLPDKDSIWSVEGTKGHEVLEGILRTAIDKGQDAIKGMKWGKDVPLEMLKCGAHAAGIIYSLHKRLPGSEILVETRISLPFIHPEMFGTFDGAVIDYFGTLHVFDYKYGAGHSVSPTENLQMIFYGLGLAAKYAWNFKRVRLWIIQPRIKGYNGPTFWELSILDLKKYVPIFERAVERVLKEPDKFAEGAHCHFCKAKGICPIKNEGRLQKAKAVFAPIKRGV